MEWIPLDVRQDVLLTLAKAKLRIEELEAQLLSSAECLCASDAREAVGFVVVPLNEAHQQLGGEGHL